MKARIIVAFKPSVLDPQGQTVKNALLTMGYESITDVRQGKVFEVDFKKISRKEAARIIPEIARKVLANPIIETFSWQLIKDE